MKIAVIGAGSVGSTLGSAWRRLGHDVVYGVPQPDAGKYGSLDAPVTTNRRAAREADVVVLCTPWQATRQAVADCGDLSGKVLVDCTNPLTPDAASLAVGHTTSGAEQVAGWAPGARVCKAMNQIGAPMMDQPKLAQMPVMFTCGAPHRSNALPRGRHRCRCHRSVARPRNTSNDSRLPPRRHGHQTQGSRPRPPA